jgi:DNA-binding NarL/FixJ family response regulator
MKGNNQIKIFLVDDHQIVIDGLIALLNDAPDFEIIGSTTNPLEVENLLEKMPPDVVLTDVMMPELTGQVLAKRIRQKFRHVKILALSMSGQADTVEEMIHDADISGYVLKNISKEALTHAIRRIAGGGIYFQDEVLEEMQKNDRIKKENNSVNLTNREIEIIKLLEKEMNTRDIANMLFISERTVETHRKNIFRKTQTNSLIGLVKYAYEHKLV